MAFSVRSYRRFSVQCAVTYHSSLLPRAGQDLEPHLYRLASLCGPLKRKMGRPRTLNAQDCKWWRLIPVTSMQGRSKEENSTTSKLFMRIERSPKPA